MLLFNRLSRETSPYLLQHAHNPVDWYAWGSEALGRARREDKPIFLSIGYAACHWCHVMAHESFENAAVADLLNRHFVAIKVDREERPDLDEVYMAAAQAITGSGGWPLSVFLTPDLRPFYAGTYFPPETRYGLPGFASLLEGLARLWETRREALLQDAGQLTAALREGLRGHAEEAGALDPGAAQRAVAALAEEFDPAHGGFGPPPKFPPVAALDLLLRAGEAGEKNAGRTPAPQTAGETPAPQDADGTPACGAGVPPASSAAPASRQPSGPPNAPGPLLFVTRTLDAMARGGIRDHLGGGFHRYSTDARWLVPHFEKMLYDQAQLARVYCDAWLATGRCAYRRVARETLDYLLRDLRDEAGGFHSSEDADSPAGAGGASGAAANAAGAAEAGASGGAHRGGGNEGLFYTWTPAEIRAALAADSAEAERFIARYGVTDAGNFERRNILHLGEDETNGEEEYVVPPSGGSSTEGLSAPQSQPAEAGTTYSSANERLRLAREARPRPARDDKVLAAWNGLAISALARAGAAMNEPRYLEAAARAARFVLGQMRRSDGRLLRSWRAGVARQSGFLDDYAEMGRALLDLFEADGALEWLDAAEVLARDMLALFVDPATGGFCYAASDAPEGELLVRTQPFADGPVPPGNAAAADLLLRLGQILGGDAPKSETSAAGGGEAFAASGRRAIEAQAAAVARVPRAFLYLLGVARDRLFDPPREVVIVGPANDAATAALVAETRRRFLPGWTVLTLDPTAPDASQRIERLAPLAGRTMRGGRPTAYVCRGGACREPVTTPQALAAQLDDGPH